jgi:transcriptional regulator with XRE-family HTH domain
MQLRVKELRDEKGWNQTILGYHAELSPSEISLIENGKRNPSATTLQRIATALGVEVGDLFPKAGAPRRSAEDRPPELRRSHAEGWISALTSHAAVYEQDARIISDEPATLSLEDASRYVEASSELAGAYYATIAKSAREWAAFSGMEAVLQHAEARFRKARIALRAAYMTRLAEEKPRSIVTAIETKMRENEERIEEQIAAFEQANEA